MIRTAKLWGFTLGLAIVLAGMAYSHVPLVTSGGVEVRWPFMPVNYYINQAGSRSILPGAAFPAIRSCFNTWQNVPTSSVAFVDMGLTPFQPGLVDGRNVVGFVSEQSSVFSGADRDWILK